MDMIQTAKSKLLTPYKAAIGDDLRFSEVLAKYRSSQQEDNQFPLELISPENEENSQQANGKSCFEVNGNKKKQRGRDLMHFL